MKIKVGITIWRRIGWKLGTKLLLWAENNDDARMENNGEAWLLRALANDWAGADRATKRIVIDAGANRGDFSAAVLAAADGAGVPVEVFAFEPGPSAATELASRFTNERRVTIINAAVSDFEGRAPLFDSSGASTLASLVQRGLGAQQATLEVAVTMLAAFLEKSGLKRIDLLKLDVEGAELAALRGLGEWLNPTRVAAIQFEYGGTTLDAGDRLRDFFELFESRGYRVAKLFPRWLEMRTYSPWMDGFSYSNWVTIGKGETPK